MNKLIIFLLFGLIMITPVNGYTFYGNTIDFHPDPTPEKINYSSGKEANVTMINTSAKFEYEQAQIGISTPTPEPIPEIIIKQDSLFDKLSNTINGLIKAVITAIQGI